VKTSDPGHKRLFFALWPDTLTRTRLAAMAHQWVPHPVPAENLHMTLQFLGGCDADVQACCLQAASRVRAEGFSLCLDYLGSWPHKGIQWLGSGQPPAALLTLVERLGEALEACGFQPDKRRFVPHVTLSRKAKNPVIRSSLPAIDWVLNEFVLAESVSSSVGVRYVVLARWPLE